jgi:hypothetical protein
MNDDPIGKALGVSSIAMPEIQEPSQIDDDYELARANLRKIIESGGNALEDLIQLADTSQHPRAYEVIGSLIKSLSDANKDLLELSKRKRDLTGETGTKTINNNLFVGSTTELQKMLKDMRNDNG